MQYLNFCIQQIDVTNNHINDYDRKYTQVLFLPAEILCIEFAQEICSDVFCLTATTEESKLRLQLSLT